MGKLWKHLQVKSYNRRHVAKFAFFLQTAQAGLPVITVEQRSADNKLTLSQRRFFLNPSTNPDGKTYFVPINSVLLNDNADFSDTTAKQWFMDSDDTISYDLGGEGAYILNTKETGYYRVNYDATNWEKLISTLDSDRRNIINKLNRAQMLDDSFNLARASQVDYGIPLDLFKSIDKENEYVPLEAGLRGFDYVDLMIRTRTEDYETHLKPFMLDLLDLPFDNFGGLIISTNVKYSQVLAQISLANKACDYGMSKCIQPALEQFNQWMSESNPDSPDENPIFPDMKTVVYDIGAREGGAKAWDFLFQRFLASEVSAEQQTILYSLGETRNESALQHYLEMSIDSNSGIRKQDTVYVYNSVGSSEVGRNVQFNWLQNNFDEIYNYFGETFPSYVDNMLNGYLEAANTDAELQRVIAFLDEHRAPLGSATAVLERGIEGIETNIKWMDDNYESVMNWIQFGATGITSTSMKPSTTSRALVQAELKISAIGLSMLCSALLHIFDKI